ncbi:MAG: response regulator [Candidatus Margulisbacteria bacterium]|nr:response regulator [Candidatus Margulisiibacteriota bacterium]MBU1616439.1 response regulator [Candidatus Margulisiibacteriota bacterium]MBU1866881.1 response regulator [Candidatus Margulisiibacteriota bacterium]
MAEILVADDQESMRHIISDLLKRAGHSVKSTEDGIQALEALKISPFNLVVADVNMPGMDGLEFLRHVRLNYPATKVVFITGMEEETIKTGTEGFHLDGLILKPFKEENALAAINEALAAHS